MKTIEELKAELEKTNLKIMEENILMISEALLLDENGDLLRYDSLDWENVRRLPQYQQILSDHERAQKYNDYLVNPGAIIELQLSRLEKLSKENQNLKADVISQSQDATIYHFERDQLKKEIERINDKLGNELQVKVLEIEELKEQLIKTNDVLIQRNAELIKALESQKSKSKLPSTGATLPKGCG